MKKGLMIITFAAALFGSTFASANEVSNTDLKKAVQVYTESLKHSNTGIIESTIFNIMRMKKQYADVDYSAASTQMEALLVNPPSEIIRYKAFIAINYLENPERFPWIEEISPEKSAEFFHRLSEKLIEQLAGA
ncbi:MAG: hypothetical protein AAFP70_03200 [Calditrichota bacterium]